MTQAHDTFFENRTKVFLALVLPAACLYFKSLKFGFTTMDEQWMIIQSVSFLEKWENLKIAFTAPIAEVYYRPLFSVSLFMDYHLGKLSPVMYHVTNLIWHLLSVILLHRFLILLKIPGKSAFVYALLFSVHPLMLHAVAWIPGRNDTMLCVFALFSLIYLHKFNVTSKKQFIFLHALFFSCALLTKECAIVLPLVYMLLLSRYYQAALKSLFLFMGIWALVVFTWMLCRYFIVGHSAGAGIDLSSVVKHFLPALMIYAGKALFPVQQSIYPTLNNSTLIPGILVLAVLIILSFKPGLKNQTIAFTGLLIFFLILAVPIAYSVSGGGDQLYEHRAYTALTGLVLFFTQVKFEAGSKRFVYASGLLLLLFSIKTYMRMNVYRNELSFVEAGVKECPGSHLFHLQKGDLNSSQNNFQAALESYSKSISIRSDYGPLYSNRGVTYLSLGMYEKAISDYTKAISLSKKFDKNNYYNRCMAYAKCNDIENAMKDLFVVKKCCAEIISPEIEKDVTTKWISLIEKLSDQTLTEPRNDKPYFKMARLFFDIEMIEEGVRHLKTAIRLAPSNPEYTELLLKYTSVAGK